MSQTEAQKGIYKKLSAIVDHWLELHKGETFDLDMVCRHLEIRERENRNLVTIKLAYAVKRGFLEKNNKLYRYIDNTIKRIDWVNASEQDILDIGFPHGHETIDGGMEDSFFGFDGHVSISPGDILVITGDSNVGKTTFAHNLIWENMDNFPCRLMGNEYAASKFKRRVRNMTWANPLKENGEPKFELIERRDSWHYAIEPDSINVIDWILLSGEEGHEFYTIGAILDKIQAKLNKGIAVVVLQKSPGKTLARGGGPSVDLSSLYLSIDFERLIVVKAKEWHGHNPNNEIYGFSIVNHGTQFHNIRRIKKCPRCYGMGHSKGGQCDHCLGSGYVDFPD